MKDAQRGPQFFDERGNLGGDVHYNKVSTGCHLDARSRMVRNGIVHVITATALVKAKPDNATKKFSIIKHVIKMSSIPALGSTPDNIETEGITLPHTAGEKTE